MPADLPPLPSPARWTPEPRRLFAAAYSRGRQFGPERGYLKSGAADASFAAIPCFIGGAECTRRTRRLNALSVFEWF